MLVGMLWWDDSLTALSVKIQKAADYYQKKYGRAPDLCLVHPQMLSSETGIPGAEGGVTVRPWRSIPLHHFWIGVEDMPTREHAAEVKPQTEVRQLSFMELQG